MAITLCNSLWEKVITHNERENILMYVATDGSKDYFHSFFCLPIGKQIGIQS